jgi:hypothetical protein
VTVRRLYALGAAVSALVAAPTPGDADKTLYEIADLGRAAASVTIHQR